MPQRISSPFGTVMVTPEHDSMIERMFGEARPAATESTRVPPVDVYETAEVITVVMDLPGVQKADIQIGYSAGAITVNADAKGSDFQGGHWLLHERRTGHYIRTINLGRAIDPKAISASYNDGILELTVKKPRGQEHVTIAVS
jgi:HSP20 family protein